MGIFEILLMAGFVLAFLLMVDHGNFTFKALLNRWMPSKSKAAKVLPFEIPRFGFKKPVKTL